jgi:hypothetical protein
MVTIAALSALHSTITRRLGDAIMVLSWLESLLGGQRGGCGSLQSLHGVAFRPLYAVGSRGYFAST